MCAKSPVILISFRKRPVIQIRHVDKIPLYPFDSRFYWISRPLQVTVTILADCPALPCPPRVILNNESQPTVMKDWVTFWLFRELLSTGVTPCHYYTQGCWLLHLWRHWLRCSQPQDSAWHHDVWAERAKKRRNYYNLLERKKIGWSPEKKLTRHQRKPAENQAVIFFTDWEMKFHDYKIGSDH